MLPGHTGQGWQGALQVERGVWQKRRMRRRAAAVAAWSTRALLRLGDSELQAPVPPLPAPQLTPRTGHTDYLHPSSVMSHVVHRLQRAFLTACAAPSKTSTLSYNVLLVALCVIVSGEDVLSWVTVYSCCNSG